jgi:hypothetical protein
MPRHRTGSAVAKKKKRGGKVIKVWFARITYYDETGKRRQETRKANNKTNAKEVARKMLEEFDNHGPQAFDAAHMSFAQLAEYYKQTYLVDPEYVEGRKVLGLRSKYDSEFRLNTLKVFFRNKGIRSITHGDLERYRTVRLKTPTKHTKQRSIATVHRELSILRRVLNVAVANGWLLKNPFQMGKSLINPGMRSREREY